MNGILAIATTAIAASLRTNATVVNLGDVTAGIPAQAGSIADSMAVAPISIEAAFAYPSEQSTNVLKVRRCGGSNSPRPRFMSGFNTFWTVGGLSACSIHGSGYSVVPAVSTDYFQRLAQCGFDLLLIAAVLANNPLCSRDASRLRADEKRCGVIH